MGNEPSSVREGIPLEVRWGLLKDSRILLDNLGGLGFRVWGLGFRV